MSGIDTRDPFGRPKRVALWIAVPAWPASTSPCSWYVKWPTSVRKGSRQRLHTDEGERRGYTIVFDAPTGGRFARIAIWAGG